MLLFLIPPDFFFFSKASRNFAFGSFESELADEFSLLTIAGLYLKCLVAPLPLKLDSGDGLRGCGLRSAFRPWPIELLFWGRRGRAMRLQLELKGLLSPGND